MLTLLAWRNIWRNPTRSLVVIFAIAIGILAALFMTGFATGMIRSYIDSTIATVVSHLQIHHPEYAKERDVRLDIPETARMLELFQKEDKIKAFSPRTLASGMVSSAKTSRGILIKGILPESEASVGELDENIREGAFFESGRSNQIVMGQKLAEKLQVRLRSKVVLTFQDLEGNITTGAFRITGLYNSNNTVFDEGNVFVLQEDLSRLLAGSHPLPAAPVHEIAVLCQNPEAIEPVQQLLKTAFPAALTENYREIAPELQLYESQIKSVSLIYLTVIMLALIFGIINTMLMSVLERFRELGMLMSIGMNKTKVFGMIVLETVLLSLAGAPLGLLAGALLIRYFGIYGLDLSAFAKSLNQYGMGTEVFFEVEPSVYWQTALLLVITAFLAALYPAFKAIRLNPVEAIRKI